MRSKEEHGQTKINTDEGDDKDRLLTAEFAWDFYFHSMFKVIVLERNCISG